VTASAEALREACGENALYAWLRAHQTTGDERALWWERSLTLDTLPIRAPLRADEIIRAVAAETGAGLIDVAREQEGYQGGAYFTDGIHTNPRGAEALGQAIAAGLGTR
jgi:hypothetical protein